MELGNWLLYYKCLLINYKMIPISALKNVFRCSPSCKCAENIQKTILHIPMSKDEEKLIMKDFKHFKSIQRRCPTNLKFKTWIKQDVPYKMFL